jgi:hypothetical protein
MALRSVWVASYSSATSGVFTVSADFVPAAAFPENVGGVMGWLDQGTQRGLAVFVSPSDRFYVKRIDFTATTGAANESLTNVFNLDGSPATEDTTSAASSLGDHDPSRPATFELVFAAPNAADLVALTNATARVTARVLQAPAGGGAPVLMGRAMELLIDLPQPAASSNRFGYFGYWGLAGFDGSSIGTFDNLWATNVGAAEPPPTEPPNPPSLTIALNGATVEVSWPVEYRTFHLEASPTVGPATWTSIPTSNNRFSTNAVGGPQFFRLSR